MCVNVWCMWYEELEMWIEMFGFHFRTLLDLIQIQYNKCQKQKTKEFQSKSFSFISFFQPTLYTLSINPHCQNKKQNFLLILNPMIIIFIPHNFPHGIIEWEYDATILPTFDFNPYRNFKFYLLLLSHNNP